MILKVRKWVPFLVGLSASLALCGTALALRAPRKLPSYDELYPRYIEICAMNTQSRLGKRSSIFGHSVTYLKGACLEQPSESRNPRIRNCSEEMDLTQRDSGVGLSSNFDLNDTNWVGVEKASLFFDGKNDEGTILPTAELVDLVEQRGYYKGIKFLEDRVSKRHMKDHGGHLENPTTERMVIFENVGTEVGIRLGRSLECMRVPITDNQLDEIVNYYNQMNIQAQEGDRSFIWDRIKINCAHVAFNAVARTGAWGAKQMRRNTLRQLGNFVLPFGAVKKLSKIALQEKLPSPLTLFRKRNLRKALVEHNWLPYTPGAMFEFMPQFGGVEDENIWGASGDAILSSRGWLEDLAYNQRATDVHVNLIFNLQRFHGAKNGIRSKRYYHNLIKKKLRRMKRHVPSSALRMRLQEFDTFYDAYVKYLEEKIWDIRRTHLKF